MISIHAPQWGATSTMWMCQPSRLYFNPRTPVGCDGTSCCRIDPQSYFNPRTPVGCDRRGIPPTPKSSYFNPRTPVGCDVGQQQLGGLVDISIHAPQWGATTTQHPADPRTLFQSTHPSGVRPLPPNCLPPAPLFQSTHPSGVRLGLHHATADRVRISIHAPQWGATMLMVRFKRWVTHFNPRTPVGCDKVVIPGGKSAKISIHAPQWGATPRIIPARSPSSDFNPRTPVGCDCFRWRAWGRFWYFNPRTPVGCDPPRRTATSESSSFQSTHPSGVRRKCHHIIC